MATKCKRWRPLEDHEILLYAGETATGQGVPPRWYDDYVQEWAVSYLRLAYMDKEGARRRYATKHALRACRKWMVDEGGGGPDGVRAFNLGVLGRRVTDAPDTIRRWRYDNLLPRRMHKEELE